MKRLDATLMELKKANKAMADQLSKFNQQPAAAPAAGQVLSVEELARDPFAALKKAGLTYQDLTNRMVEGGGPTAEDALRQLESTRNQLTQEIQAARGEAAAIRNGLTKERIEMGLHKGIASDGRFNLLQADPETAVTDAMSEMARHYADYGEVLPVPALLAKVQSTWVDKLKKLDTHQAVQKTLGFQSGQPAPTPQPVAAAPTPPASAPASPGAGNGSRTLTNDVHATPPPGAAPSTSGSRAIDRRRLIADVTKRMVPPNAWGESTEE